MPELAPHTLLRIAGHQALAEPTAVPPWAQASLGRAPWVVVRRGPQRGTLIPVGVRGAARPERFAAWLDPAAVLESLTPFELTARRAWAGSARRARIRALAVLDAVEALMRVRDLAWGPCGSVGFELASGVATATADSDLDLLLRPGEPLPRAGAAALLAVLGGLPVRVDAQLETPAGAVALAEYASGTTPLVLRTADGPRLVP